jgi:hypothetical protein
MTWQPGQSGNPAGYTGPRHYTTRHKLHREVFEKIKDLGHKDALLTLSEIQNDPTKDDALRVTAAGLLAPFQHPKLQALPTPRYIATPIDVPDFKTIDDAKQFLARIPALIARGELDLDFADSLTKSTVAWLQLQYAEMGIDLKAQAQGHTNHDTTIHISGGLPQILGTTIGGMEKYPVVSNELIAHNEERIAHRKNGHALPDPLTLNPSSIDGVHTATPATPTESIPGDASETKAQEP